MIAPDRPPTRLYLISPPEVADLDAFATELQAALAAGDVACFQLRLKSPAGVPASDDWVLKVGTRIAPLVQGAGVAFLLNDRPDLADRLGADGVHIGQKDTPYAAARRLMGPDRTVGVTCHASRHLAMEAGEAGADYVAFGAFYPTRTKSPDARAEPDLLSWWQALMEVPCVAIGGITADNAAPLAAAGADFVAVSAGVWQHPGGAATGVAALNASLKVPAV
jgi:thiamine-phosphate pyrophosphorylase